MRENDRVEKEEAATSPRGGSGGAKQSSDDEERVGHGNHHHHRSTRSSGMESDVHAEVISAAELNALVSRMNGNGSSAAGESNA